jgi:hypothetical protein
MLVDLKVFCCFISRHPITAPHYYCMGMGEERNGKEKLMIEVEQEKLVKEA